MTDIEENSEQLDKPPTSPPLATVTTNIEDPDSGKEDNLIIPVQQPVVKEKKDPLTPDQRWGRANIILNGILAIATISLFWIAYQSLKISNTTQKQFLLANQPYLQIVRPMVYLTPESLVRSEYLIVNLEETPVKMLGQMSKTGWGDTMVPFSQFKKDFYKLKDDEINNVNSYVIKETPIQDSTFSSLQIPPNITLAFARAQTYIFLLGGVKYINLITNEIKIYWYEIRFKKEGSGVRADYLVNDNLPINDNPK